MLLPLMPPSIKTPAISPSEHAKAFFLVVRVLPAECTAVWPRVLATSVNHGSLPHAAELTPVLANVMPEAIDGVSLPFPSVDRRIGPLVDADALLLAPDELTTIAGATLPLLNSLAVLQVFDPLTSVCGLAFPVVVGAQ